MKYNPFKKPPTALYKARMDNISIIPGNLLPFKNKWDEIANGYPQGTILLCHNSSNPNQKKLLENLSTTYKNKGRNVVNLSIEQML